MSTDPPLTLRATLPRALDGRWAWLAAVAAGLLILPIYFALPAGSTEQSVLYDVIGLTFIAAAAFGLWKHRIPGMSAWLLMIAGQLAFVVGDLMWMLYSAWGENPFPSLADAAYLSGYPLLALGLALAIRRRVAGGDRAGLLDGAILATGAGICWWAIVLGPLAAAADPEPLAFAISMAYPIGDLLLIGIAVALAVTPGAKGASYRLLIGSLLTILVADLVFSLQGLEGTYTDGSYLDALWIFGYVLFGAAALHPSMVDLVEPRPVSVSHLGLVRLLLLGAAMLVGPGLLILEQSTATAATLVVAVATAGLSVLVLGRLAVLVRQLDRDIQRRKALEAQLAFQAFHDPLTGLANRRRFVAAVNDALAAPGSVVALFLDLDDFKHVNDRLGHDAGDLLLVAVGERLLAAVRPNDVVCRLGGDEFAVLLPRVDGLQDAEAVAARLIDGLRRPVEIEAEQIGVSASVGVAVREVGTVLTLDELLRRADTAMYHAKARGKNRWTTYVPEMDKADSPATTLARRPAAA